MYVCMCLFLCVSVYMYIYNVYNHNNVTPQCEPLVQDLLANSFRLPSRFNVLGLTNHTLLGCLTGYYLFVS